MIIERSTAGREGCLLFRDVCMTMDRVQVWIGLVWCEIDWIGLDWILIGLYWILDGLDWIFDSLEHI